MRWASLLLGFVVGLVAAQTLKFPVPQGQTIKATVVSVTDGDTIKVRVGNELQTVRIIGYDSPELNQPFGDKASLYLKALLEGREVILESDVQATDKYGRRLYHVWLPQVLVGELMLLSGLGQIMTIPPNVRHSDYYQRVQTAARSVGLGIWAVPFPTGRATQERATQGRATQEGSDMFTSPEQGLSSIGLAVNICDTVLFQLPAQRQSRGATLLVKFVVRERNHA
jgi:endonuclease YncB( thermonuclease family)